MNPAELLWSRALVSLVPCRVEGRDAVAVAAVDGEAVVVVDDSGVALLRRALCEPRRGDWPQLLCQRAEFLQGLFASAAALRHVLSQLCEGAAEVGRQLHRLPG